MSKIEIFKGLDYKNERMPAKMSLPKPKMSYIPLVNPSTMVQFHAGIKRNLAPFKSISKENIRADMKERLSQAIETVNTYVTQGIKLKNVSFSYHEESGRSYMVMKDSRSGEVLKKYPGDFALNMAAQLKQASGLGSKIDI